MTTHTHFDRSSRSRFDVSGFTLIELIVTVTIVAILSGLAVPLVRNNIKRDREYELRRALREILSPLISIKKHPIGV